MAKTFKKSKRFWLNPKDHSDTGMVSWKVDGDKYGCEGTFTIWDCSRKVSLNFWCESEKEAIQRVDKIDKLIEALQEFKQAMEEAEVPIPKSNAAYSVQEALDIVQQIGYPVIVRTAYMLGGGGAGIAYDDTQLQELVEQALEWSIEHQVLIEQYLGNWKESARSVKRREMFICLSTHRLTRF